MEGTIKRKRSSDHGASAADDTSDLESDKERPEEYCQGGYFPMTVGMVLDNRYKVTAKLGWGVSSTVWEAEDLQDNHKLCALKIVKSAEQYTEAAKDEIQMMKKLTENDPEGKSFCIRLLNTFEVTSKNGTHTCMVFEKMGSNLLSLIKLYRYEGIPIPIVKVITKQILIALDYVDKCGITHTDLKPENVLLQQQIHLEHNRSSGVLSKKSRDELSQQINLTPENCKVCLADFGNATWADAHFTNDVQTAEYRSPEVILGGQWDGRVDVWALGCLVFELVTGEFLFKPKRSELMTEEESHLVCVVCALGPFPPHALRGCRRAERYFDDGRLKAMKEKKRALDIAGRLIEFYGFNEEDANSIADFLSPMLTYDPKKRARAKDMINHPWLADVPLP